MSTGLMVFHARLVLQLLDPEGIVQLVAVIVPVIAHAFAINVAIHVLSASIVTCPPVLHAPLHPVRVESMLGIAERFIRVQELYNSTQSSPQLIPTGVDVIVPDPVPALDVIRLCVITRASQIQFPAASPTHHAGVYV